jgi:hypothetical protein
VPRSPFRAAGIAAAISCHGTREKSGHCNNFDSYLQYRRRAARAAAVPGFDPNPDMRGQGILQQCGANAAQKHHGASQPRGHLFPLLVPVELPETFAPRLVEEQGKDSANIFNGKAKRH